MSSGRAPNQGFTLIEVMVATVLLALGLIGALTAFTLASRATGSSRNATLLPLLAEEKLSEVRSVPRNDLAPGTVEGDFGEKYPGYTWTLRVAEPDELHVVAVELTIHAPEAGHTRDVRFATRIF